MRVACRVGGGGVVKGPPATSERGFLVRSRFQPWQKKYTDRRRARGLSTARAAPTRDGGDAGGRGWLPGENLAYLAQDTCTNIPLLLMYTYFRSIRTSDVAVADGIFQLVDHVHPDVLVPGDSLLGFRPNDTWELS